MGSRPETTRAISALLEEKINPHNDSRTYWAKEVTFDYSSNHSVRVDYMVFKPMNNTISGIEKGDFYCYEIKSSVEDYMSGHGLNFIGDYNYIVMPLEVFNQIQAKGPTIPAIPWKVGILCNDGNGKLVSIKKAQRMSRERSVSEMLLMMFRSNQRELRKIQSVRSKTFTGIAKAMAQQWGEL